MASARVELVRVGFTDDDLASAIAGADWVGIDAPFGWPTAFVNAMADYAERRVWPGTDREPLRLRDTDRFVREQTGLTPMSVSTDRIGSTAMRCASLLTKLAEPADRPVDLAGSDRIVEVYPAAALKVWADDARGWGLAWTGYNGKEGRVGRERILGALTEIVEPLAIDDADVDRCHRSDDALDALVCALIARAAATGLTTHDPGPDRVETASRQGWIHVPESGSLARLHDWVSGF